MIGAVIGFIPYCWNWLTKEHITLTAYPSSNWSTSHIDHFEEFQRRGWKVMSVSCPPNGKTGDLLNIGAWEEDDSIFFHINIPAGVKPGQEIMVPLITEDMEELRKKKKKAPEKKKVPEMHLEKAPEPEERIPEMHLGSSTSGMKKKNKARV